MADTERSVNDLLTMLFQDGQVAGSLTPQDMRDLIVSLAPDFGGMHVSVAVETVIAAIDTPTKALGTTVIAGSVRGVSMPANNRLQHDGDASRLFLVECAFSMTSAGNNIITEIGLAKNGVYEVNSAIQRKTGTGSDIGAGAISFHISLAANDFIELFLTNRTDGTNLTIEFMSMNIVGLLE